MLEVWEMWRVLVRWPLCMSSGVWVKVPATAGAPPPNRMASSHQTNNLHKSSREHMQHNHLGAQRLGRLEHVQQLRVVDLQQHACDLPCQVGVHVLNQRKETLTCKGRERKTEGEKAVTTAQKQDFQIKLKFRNSPSICFCSWGGAAASMEAVRGSWPCTCTAG